MEDWAIRLYQRLAGKEILVSVILGDGDIEVADDAFVLLKLKMSPLAIVDELLQGLLQIVEYAFFRTRNLGMVDGNLSLQLLCRNRRTAAQEATS